MLVDTHCHLDFPDFADDISGIIARARMAGITRMVTISTRVARFGAYAALADAHPESGAVSAHTRTRPAKKTAFQPVS
jgi:TatD DNase family protein